MTVDFTTAQAAEYADRLRRAAPGEMVPLPAGVPADVVQNIEEGVRREKLRQRHHESQQKDEPAWKQDGDKARLDLIAPEFLFGTAEVLRYGAAKYAERNWEKGMSWGRCFGALQRHLWAWWRGEERDAETGISHLYHAACCLMFLAAYEERKIGKDDRTCAST